MLRFFRIVFATITLMVSLVSGAFAFVVQPSVAVSEVPLAINQAAHSSAMDHASSNDQHRNADVAAVCDQHDVHSHAHCSGCGAVLHSLSFTLDPSRLWQTTLRSFALHFFIDSIEYPPESI